MTGRKRNGHVLVNGRIWGPEEDMPAEVEKAITNPKAFVTDDEPDRQLVPEGTADPVDLMLDGGRTDRANSSGTQSVGAQPPNTDGQGYDTTPPDGDPPAGTGDPEVNDPPAVQPPPMDGPKGSTAEWVTYAGAVGVDVSDLGAKPKRAEVIDRIAKAGHPVERTTE